MTVILKSGTFTSSQAPLHMRAARLPEVNAPEKAAGVGEVVQLKGISQIAAAEVEIATPEVQESHQKQFEDLRKRASEEGYRDGLVQAREAFDEEWRPLTGQLKSLLEALSEQKARTLELAEDELIALAFEAVCRIVGDRAVSQESVKKAIHGELALRNDGMTVVRVSAKDMEDLADDFQRLMQDNGDKLKIIADERVALGGCIVGSDRGTLDARLETQMERLRQCLLDARDSSPDRSA